MNFGLSETTCTTIRHILERYSKVEKAVIYGSRAKGNYKNGSDIDLTLMGDALDHQTLSEIAGELDDSFIPYTVDLSIYAALNHAKLREHIDRVGVVFYERGTAGQHQGVAIMKKGWQTKMLGEICDIERGGSPRPIKDFITSDPNGINWIKIGDATASGKYIYKTEEKIKPEGVKCSRMVYEGDFILSNSMSFGRPYIMKTTGCIHDGWLVLHQPKVDPDYLYHALSSDLVFDQFDRLAAGSTVRNLNIGLAKSVEIPYPPLAEQRRIVGLLDEAFEGIATAKANAEKNLQNARALFESHLQSVFTQRGPGWVDRALDQVCIVERGSSPRPIKEYFTTKPDGVNWIKIGDTEEGGKYVHTTAQKITPEGARQSRFVKEGDFILTNSMSYGRPYIMKTSGYIHDGWFVLRLNMAIDTDYFYYLLSSSVVQLQFASLASGSVVKNISGDLVKKAMLPIPPLEHQHIIVKKLLEMSEETHRLASLYERKLAALEALKKSLLHQAFTGAL